MTADRTSALSSAWGKRSSGLWMKNGPAAQLVVAADRPQLLGRAAVVLENLPVNGRAEADGADAELLDREEIGGQFRPADVAQIAVGEDQSRQAVDALGAKERFGDGLHGIGRAAVDQQVVGRARGVEVDGHAAVEGQDGQARDGARLPELPAPEAHSERERGDLPGAQFGLEDPAGQDGQQNRVIQAGSEEGRLRDIEIGARPAREPMAADPDAFHQKPAGMVEEFGGGRKPAGQQQAGQVADQDQRAERHGEHIGRCADRSDDVKVIGDQRQGADPRRKGGERQVSKVLRWHPQGLPPARTQLLGQQGVGRGQAAAQFAHGREDQDDAQDDEEGELKAGLEKLPRLPGENDERRRKEGIDQVARAPQDPADNDHAQHDRGANGRGRPAGQRRCKTISAAGAPARTRRGTDRSARNK